MKIPKIVDAMQYIDEELITWAEVYTPRKTSAWKNIGKACACFVVITLLYVYFMTGTKYSLVLTAYATSSVDGSTESYVLEKGEKIPIHIFTTDTDLTGFVFSTENTADRHEPSSIVILSEGSTDTHIHEIIDLVTETGKKYYFYVLSPNTMFPETIKFYISDQEMSVQIIEEKEGYYAVLQEIKVLDTVYK